MAKAPEGAKYEILHEFRTVINEFILFIELTTETPPVEMFPTLYEILSRALSVLREIEKRPEVEASYRILSSDTDRLFRELENLKSSKTNLKITSSPALEPDTKLLEEMRALSLEVQSQIKRSVDFQQLFERQHEKLSSDLQAANMEHLTKLQTEIDLVRTELQTQADEEVIKFKELVGQARELLNFTQGRALSGFFAARASEEKKSAKNWTITTWIFAILTLISILTILIYQLFFPSETKADFSLLATKILFTATLGFTAKWTSKRANRHLAEESKYHRLSVNISTIDSFVEKLDEESRKVVLSAVGLKIFAEVEGNETATDFETASAADFIKGLLPKIEK
jgi:hypothetical protein